jgi:hypothetical protein
MGPIRLRRQYSWARTGLAQRRKKQMLGQNQLGPATYLTWGEGELFFPLPSCMQNANLHAGTNQQKMQTMEGKKNLPGAEEAAAC